VATPIAEAHPEAAAEQAPAEEQVEEAAAPEGPTGNGYAPAERQAESLAQAAQDNDEPAPTPEPATVEASANEDGRPAVPARRRGLIRRLFSK